LFYQALHDEIIANASLGSFCSLCSMGKKYYGSQCGQLFGYQHLILCLAEEINSYRFGTWGWV